MWIGEAPLPEVGDDVGEPLRNEAAVVAEQRALELSEHGEVLWDVLGQGVPRQELVLEPVHGVEHPEDHARWVERAVDVLRCTARTKTAPSSALTFQTSCSSGRSCSDDRATPRRALTAAPHGPRRRQRPARPRAAGECASDPGGVACWAVGVEASGGGAVPRNRRTLRSRDMFVVVEGT
jgi:hypothetical protein